MSKKNKIFMIIGIFFVVLLIFITTSIFILIKDDYKAIPYKDFVDFEIEKIFKNNREYLLVSGQYYGSSLKIKKVKEEYNNDNIILKVYMTLFSKNNSAFIHPIELKGSVNKVLFGDEKKVIWENDKKTD